MHNNNEATQTVTTPDTGRWDLIKSVVNQYDEAKLMALVMRLCEGIADTNRNVMLRYYLIRLRLVSETRGDYKDRCISIINKLTRQQFQNLLTVCEKIIKDEHDPDMPHNATVNEMHTHALHLLNELQSTSQELEVLSESGNEAINSLENSLYTHHVEYQERTPTSEVIQPLFGAIAVAQAFYEAFLHDAAIRNAFDEYRKTLRSIKLSKVNAATEEYEDPDLQISQIKNDALSDICSKMFANTLYAGTVYSVSLGIIIHTFLPFAYVYTGAGLAISVAAARNNSKKMRSKVVEFLDNPEFDTISVELINQDHNNSSPEEIHTCIQESMTTLSRSTSYGMRYVALVKIMFLPFVPLVTGVGSTINSLFSWRSTHKYIKNLRDNPLLALQLALNIDAELPDILKYKGSNLIRTFLMQVRGIDTVENDLIANDVSIMHESKFMGTVRSILAPLGIMYDQKTHAILESLYDATNPEARRLLDDLRINAKIYQFKKDLKEYFIKNKDSLGMRGQDFKNILSSHLNGNSDKFYKLVRAYSAADLDKNVSFATWMTGLTVGASWSLLIMSVALLSFNNLTPEFAIAASSFFVASVLGTYIINKWSVQSNINLALQSVSQDDFINAIKNSKLLDRTLLKQHQYSINDVIIPEHNLQSITRQLKINAPSLFKELNSPEQMLQDFCEILNNVDSIQSQLQNAKFEVIVKDNETYILQPADQEEKQILIVKGSGVRVTPHQEFSRIDWQIYFAFMNLMRSTFCLMDFKSEQVTRDMQLNLDIMAKSFIAAIISEFMSPDYLRCKLVFMCHGATTAIAIRHTLSLPNFTLDGITYSGDSLSKVRAHFGLILINGTLCDLQNILGGSKHPFVKDYFTHNRDFLLPLEGSEAALPAPELPAVTTQIFETIKSIINSGIDLLAGADDEEDILRIEVPKFKSDNEGFDTFIIKCIRERINELELEVKDLIIFKAEIAKRAEQTASNQMPLLAESPINIDEQVRGIEREYLELQHDIKLMQENYVNILSQSSDRRQNQLQLMAKSLEYCQKREDILNSHVEVESANEHVGTRRNGLLVGFNSQRSERQADEKERKAIQKLREVISESNITPPNMV